jgi:RNA polymerase sigma-70 factor, ECF subfamily
MVALLAMSEPAPEAPDLPRTDEELMDVFRRTGERSLFEQLVHRYERELFSYLRRYLGDVELAEDVFQSTFLQVYLKRDQFEPGRVFRPWLYAVATNQAIDAQRRQKRHRMPSLDQVGHGEQGDVGRLVDLLVSHSDNPVERVDANERQRWMREAVDKLAEPLRAVVNLVYYQELKYREAAEILGVPTGTIKSRLHMAILKLNEILKSSHANEV